MRERALPDKERPGKCEPMKVLFVEDDPDIREQMKWALESDYQILEAANRSTALEVFETERPAVVTLDLGLPPDCDGISEGLATLESILDLDRSAKVIVVTGKGDRETGCKVIEYGAHDHVSKPFDLDVIRILIRRAGYICSLEREAYQAHDASAEPAFQDILGTSAVMRPVFETIARVARSNISVMIKGPTGTGKELVARAIHRESERSRGPFIAINCGAIPESLIESELFGHEKGAFTGAVQQRRGRIEDANGGTLFLDEIGELSLSLQVKLLRFLQDHRIERLGGPSVIQVDTRVIAATNVDLGKAIAEGRFREDLYYRLGAITITLPALRDRGGDIELLAHKFLKRFALEHDKKIIGFTRGALKVLDDYGWPGNVRELENTIKRAVVMATGNRLGPEDLGLTLRGNGMTGAKLREARESVEREMIEKVLSRYKGNVSKTARELGISRPTLHALLSKFALDPKSFKESHDSAHLGPSSKARTE
ncbi:MAG: PEP-CTERM-box response regulator transcription factor [Nitrospiraceae bacterium]